MVTHSSYTRLIVKTLTYRVISILADIAVVYILTRDIGLALTFGVAMVVISTIIYFAHERKVFRRDGMLYAWHEGTELIDGEEVFSETVRYRTVGDMSCTGGVRSSAMTLPEVVLEIASTTITERGETRADDRVSEAAMEDRKKAGYF